MQQTDFQKIDLTNIGDGVAVELFQHELQKVLENIHDVNAEAEAVRRIKIEFLIKPHSQREMGEVKVKCTSILAGVKPVPTSLFFMKEKGKPSAFRKDLRQENLGFDKPNEIKQVGGSNAG